MVLAALTAALHRVRRYLHTAERRCLITMMNLFLLPCLLVLLLASPVVQAQPLPTADDPVLAGYDLVEYHNLDPSQDGVLGSPAISYRHSNGYLYYFKNEANKALFVADPEKYLPAYGGFCAWGMAWEWPNQGWPWAANHMGPPCGPSDGWAILNGRLYCSIWRSYQDDFNRRQDQGIAMADARWLEYYGGGADAGPQNNGCYAWNWQECFARSIHDAVEPLDEPNRSVEAPAEPPVAAPVGIDEPLFSEEVPTTWSDYQTALQGKVTWRWTLEDLGTTEPLLIVQVYAEGLEQDEYIAFGVAEQVMQGPLVACSNRDGISPICLTVVGAGMGTSVPEEDPVEVEIRAARRNETHSMFRFSGSLLGFWREPRLPARVLFATGKVSGDSVPQPHLNDGEHREAVSGIDFLSVVADYNPDEFRPLDGDAPVPAQLEPLPDTTLWVRVTEGSTAILNGRVSVQYELFAVNMGDETEEEIVQVQLQNVEYVEEEMYVGFGFSSNVMTGLIVTCSLDEGAINEVVDCKQWRGIGTNLWPRDVVSDPGGWFVTEVATNGTHVNYTMAGRVAHVVQAQAGENSLQGENLRAICAIGRSPQDTKNPLQHHPLDREGFELAGLVPLSRLLDNKLDEAPVVSSSSAESNEDEGGKNPGLIAGLVLAGVVVLVYATWPLTRSLNWPEPQKTVA